jgi:hypothetical protein
MSNIKKDYICTPNPKMNARVAELVDALDSKSGYRKVVLVRFQSRVQHTK